MATWANGVGLESLYESPPSPSLALVRRRPHGSLRPYLGPLLCACICETAPRSWDNLPRTALSGMGPTTLDLVRTGAILSALGPPVLGSRTSRDVGPISLVLWKNLGAARMCSYPSPLSIPTDVTAYSCSKHMFDSRFATTEHNAAKVRGLPLTPSSSA